MAYAGSAAFGDRVRPEVHEEVTLARLEALARFLDSALCVPGTSIRLGADVLLDLLPGVGPLISTGLSLYLVVEARRLGAPGGMTARMLANVGIDLAISAVPVAGWVGDVFYRANLRNVALLRRHLEDAARRAAQEGSIITSWKVVR
ncbi:MAG: DUF4112 domain-containing protein [Alphaproteobacteria bacterium]|nr:DUF4112 domain-containing protein [Alphaproteobacteria bacterium]